MGIINIDLIVQSLKIPDAVYECDWLGSSKKMRLSLLQMMHRGQKPLNVTGLGFFTISLDSFRKVKGEVNFIVVL